jgi:hypothetical protein
LPGQAGFAKGRLGVLVLNLGKQLVDQLDWERVCCFLFFGLLGGHHFGHGTVLSALFPDPVPHRKSDRLLEWVSWFNHHQLREPLGDIPPAEAEANYYKQLSSQAVSA